MSSTASDQNLKKRKRKKAQIIDRRVAIRTQDTPESASMQNTSDIPLVDQDVLEEFKEVFQKFYEHADGQSQELEQSQYELDAAKNNNYRERDQDSDTEHSEDSTDDGEEEEVTKSLRRLMKENRMSVAELKSKAKRPEVVEWFDVTAQDPLLLVHLKAYRNTVPVPGHWQLKRKYLSAKRGFVKPPFELPPYIRETGITQMREAVQEKDDKRTMRAKMREKVRPKIGKIVMDYQRLHDAFFKHQTKPPSMSVQGDIYYEGKEREVKLTEKRPGVLSDELREALGMTHPLLPTPWLINMQRFGPPPSYPNLKIPGLTAPIPQGAQWGYQPGGWGKPVLDEHGNPLYGNVF
ncbi:hypothetical protein MIR68_000249 [Amoeboaphelidium protococcarum]|nr:hypothetical protein MIR68_000249 [Amoeboaphelidium protococcarum]